MLPATNTQEYVRAFLTNQSQMTIGRKWIAKTVVVLIINEILLYPGACVVHLKGRYQKNTSRIRQDSRNVGYTELSLPSALRIYVWISKSIYCFSFSFSLSHFPSYPLVSRHCTKRDFQDVGSAFSPL